MKTVRTIQDLKTEIDVYKAHGLSIGFVPTMGALHKGHLSLVQRSQIENDVTVVSIYVNPTQFDQKSDFDHYPVTLESDSELLKKQNVTLLFLPSYEELYPDGYRYKVTESPLSRNLCGAHRPGHFDGVLTVVMKLLNLIAADRAYFGEKDYQQLSLIQGMVEAFFIKTLIVPCATIREADGLAMSSRNSRLASTDREKAAKLFKLMSSDSTLSCVREELINSGFEVDYIEDIDGRRFAAVKLGGVRLIDNVRLSHD